MEFALSLSLDPLRRCKILHLVRHAEGTHNIKGVDKTSPELIDPCLSPLGWKQADDLRKYVRASGLAQRIELVITSPLLRYHYTQAYEVQGVAVKRMPPRCSYFDSCYVTVAVPKPTAILLLYPDLRSAVYAKDTHKQTLQLSYFRAFQEEPYFFVLWRLRRGRVLGTMQTAAVVFGGDNHEDDMGTYPLMVESARNDHATISSLNCPPFIAQELCRERLGVNTCDKRGSISEHKSLFPGINFSLIESDDDIFWRADVRESDDELAARGVKFIKWLWTRKEKEIAIVTHSAFLFQTLPAFSNDCHPSAKNEICKFFANSELRSVVLLDKSFIGDVAKKDYPAGIPFALDLPSDLLNAQRESSDSQHQKNGVS